MLHITSRASGHTGSLKASTASFPADVETSWKAECTYKQYVQLLQGVCEGMQKEEWRLSTKQAA